VVGDNLIVDMQPAMKIYQGDRLHDLRKGVVEKLPTFEI
jgi:hypothetical protein